MTVFKNIAIEHLRLASMHIVLSDVGENWVEGETRLATVYVTNSTELPLRDVVARVYVFGAARVEPVPIFGAVFDNEAFWSEIEPGEVKSYWIYIKAISGGTAYMSSHLWAEVVPYVHVWKGRRDETVIAD